MYRLYVSYVLVYFLMCGICCICSFDGSSFNLSSDAVKLIENRGPDGIGHSDISFENCHFIQFLSSVLHMRGKTITQQPIISENGDCLLFNGEIYSGLEVASDRNDVSVLMDVLTKTSNPVDVISSLQGEFAFIFYQSTSKRLWFGRDVFGRRSLLWNFDSGRFTLSSVVLSNITTSITWHELPAGVIFNFQLESQSHLNCIPMRPISEELFEPLKSSFTLEFVSQAVMHSELFQLNSDTDSNKLWENFKFNDGMITDEILDTLPSRLFDLAEQFLNELRLSVQRRVNPLPPACHMCQSAECLHWHSRVAVLFSGGVDSLLLAALAHLTISSDIMPIDLLNVAFEQRNVVENFDVPDRVTGVIGWKLLKERFPQRIWNFVKIDITRDELIEWRNKRICHLVRPCHTVLDDTIGCATWFASRGIGVLEGGQQQYKSPAKILLLGTGADELLGGYARHRTRFSRSGWNGVVNELEMELKRISVRNLGRDDRIIGDHGRESRLPYLDENLVGFCNRLAIYEKTNLNLPKGFGEKILLRLALCQLKLNDAAWTPKRAMQFGSRIAKMENSKEKADQKCDRLF